MRTVESQVCDKVVLAKPSQTLEVIFNVKHSLHSKNLWSMCN